MTYYEKMAFSEQTPVVSSTAQQGADQNHYFSWRLLVISSFFSDWNVQCSWQQQFSYFFMIGLEMKHEATKYEVALLSALLLAPFKQIKVTCVCSAMYSTVAVVALQALRLASSVFLDSVTQRVSTFSYVRFSLLQPQILLHSGFKLLKPAEKLVCLK